MNVEIIMYTKYLEVEEGIIPFVWCSKKYLRHMYNKNLRQVPRKKSFPICAFCLFPLLVLVNVVFQYKFLLVA